MSELGQRLARAYERPDGRPKTSNIVWAAVLVLFGLISLGGGLARHYVPVIVTGSLMASVGVFRLVISLMALSMNGHAKAPARPDSHP
jgi:hypothetical protein